ncbi:MAG TPA: CDGSH iron-sulfur domain-containing protein [Candidatus Acidoferrum sp.]|nr:CDGSH iron-sulfur domain-containing protein [Candidatus Acidoferrum sp.]
MAETAQEIKIVVTKDGPYVVSGAVPISIQVITPNKEGSSWEWKEGASFDAKSGCALCRCGHSKSKPFCDGSHARVGFDGRETASRGPYAQEAKTTEGPTLVLSDAESLCAFARFCDVGGTIWSLMERTDEPEVRQLVIREAMHCPSGRLVLHDKQAHQAHKEIEDSLPPSIGVVEDPAMGCSGPLWVRGGITVESHDGKQYEKRNRVTLCRCGASKNKPFCNGAHASIKFNDGLYTK